MRSAAESRWRRARAAALGVLLFGSAACSPVYVLRAGYTEARILWRRQPIERLLRSDRLDAETRAKLELVLAARTFARDTLHLRVDDSYATFARVDADEVVQVVSAAYRLRLQPYTWWFPIVGRVPYRGYFSLAAARAEAAELERDGYDAAVRPSVAFSTLGWFADPLVSGLLRYDQVTLADVIIHELLHTTLYLPGHADFDESFANFVGSRGALAFFMARGDPARAARARAAWADTLQFSDFIGRFAARLRAAYAAGIDLEARQRLFTAGQQEFAGLRWRTDLYAEFGRRPLNNAVILQYLMYADRLRLFAALLRQHGDDLAQTIAAVIAAAPAAADPFAAVKAQLRPAAAPRLAAAR